MPVKKNLTLKILSKNYESLKREASLDLAGKGTANALITLIQNSMKFLDKDCRQIPLVSRVPEKTYFSFKTRGSDKKISRAVNKSLFMSVSTAHVHDLLGSAFIKRKQVDRERFLYTLAMSYCCAADLLKTGDQKTPATFFECLIGHLFSNAVSVNPRTQIEVLRLEEEASTLPTDFIFDLGTGKPKFHVPVKISTRERVIQVFAHQRVLDGVHGFGKFSGILVCLAETKLDHEKKEVIEICVPKQWVLYQRFIAPMKRFYYFDVPNRYGDFIRGDPPMAVKPFASFFDEVGDLILGR